MKFRSIIGPLAFTLPAVLILLTMGAQELSVYYRWEGIQTLHEASFASFANGLMAVVLLLTVLSGFHYLFRTDQHTRSAS